MTTNSLATALALSDAELLCRIHSLAATELETTAELVAHLAALEIRPSAYAAEGYGSLFDYCTGALRFSEDAACNRIDAARVCRRFPVALDLLRAGSLTMTTARLLRPHLTEQNHQAVLARAANKSRREIEALIAALSPQPDIPASVRKLPRPRPIEAPPLAPDLFMAEETVLPRPDPSGQAGGVAPATSVPISVPPPAATGLPSSRPTVRASAPERYRVQFTIDEVTHDKLRRIQALLRREIPTGDPGLIFGQALDLLLEKVEKAKLGAAARPRPRSVIRPGTDKRHIPNDVKRAVWRRDAGQCAFVSDGGRRCTEHTFLELHHIQPYALQGPATAGNISLRCRRHNQYEAERVFGPRASRIPERAP